MFCTECGNKLPEGVKFCPECGAKLMTREAVPEPVKVEEPIKVAAPVIEAEPGQATEPVKEAEPVVEAKSEKMEDVVKEAEPIREAAPEPVAPAWRPEPPVQRPVAPMMEQQKSSGLVRMNGGVNASYFKNRNYLMVLIGNLLAFIGCFVPFVTIFGSSISLMELTVGGGSAIIIAIIVCIVFTFVKPFVVYIPCIISVCIYGANFMSLIAEDLLETLHIGAYLILVATVVALVGALKFRKEFKESAQ